ncbi:MAG: flap endonuclease, partial [SAR202 cluster bacterium]|nr:flap endonuclease [SAR202 cluster bacterium]
MKVHLVDGTYELYRAHFGVPPSTTRDGQPISAVRGLVATLLALLREDDVTHIACAFDHTVESFRNDMFDGYKTGDRVPEELASQFDLAEKAAAAVGVVVWPMFEFEADDAIGTATVRWSADPNVDQVVICSPDKDMMQLVRDPEVVCLDRRRGITYD